MSKILDKIKGFGRSLTSMFEESREEEEVSYLDPNTQEGQELAKAMSLAVEEIRQREKARDDEQNALVERLRNQREGDFSTGQDTFLRTNSIKVEKDIEHTKNSSVQKDGRANEREGRE